jgi:hypothetical protein
MMPRWRLAPSPIHGIGVVAARDYGPGNVIDRVRLVRVAPVDDFRSRPTTGQVVASGAGAVVCGAVGGFPLWYVNYSQVPNVRTLSDGWVIATTAITVGEELCLPFPGGR